MSPFAAMAAVCHQVCGGQVAYPWKGRNGLTFNYFVEDIPRNAPDNIKQLDFNGAVERALAEWARYSQLQFVKAVDPKQDRTLAIKFANGEHGDGFPFSPNGSVLAHAFYPDEVSSEPLAGDVHINQEVQLTEEMLGAIVLHEIGHALGFVHSSTADSVMYLFLRTPALGLGKPDIALLRGTYGETLIQEEEYGDLQLTITDTRYFGEPDIVYPTAQILYSASGGRGLDVSWQYEGDKQWMPAVGSFNGAIQTIPLFENDRTASTIVMRVSDNEGRILQLDPIRLDSVPAMSDLNETSRIMRRPARVIRQPSRFVGCGMVGGAHMRPQ